ncbi:MAG: DUF4301 family protein [Deltaproteobacteria bacterium]|nr:DUF4301 family protein [Deltaproteobacteria bacterium]
MEDRLFTEEDLAQIRARGMTPDDIRAQVEDIRKGFPWTELDRPCTVGDGILALDGDEIRRLSRIYEETARSGRAMKFVPASGAASRMFKLLQSVRNRPGGLHEKDLAREAEEGDEHSARLLRFFRELKNLALYDDLRESMARDGMDADGQIAEGRYDVCLEYLLGPKGMDAANLPKGLIPFHAYPDGTRRTPFEEQLVETSLTVRDGQGAARVHFTASPEHEEAIRSHLEERRPRYEGEETRLEIGLSLQMPHTDTIALDMEGRPFRGDDGRLLFRPGGHGALLENLDRLDGDLVFIKNIDNVVPDRLKDTTVDYKKALGGVLIALQEEIFRHLEDLTAGEPSGDLLDRVWTFVLTRLSLQPPPEMRKGLMREQQDFLFSRLNRPLRVCGMVRNEGEPGGGPFWVRNRDGGRSIQIVESSQVNLDSRDQEEIWSSSTHFNPVDLVCGLRDFQGRPFDLPAYRDPETGFVSTKSKGGRELRALELPGLWNGAMAEWNTVFVEVPIETFNPVKTVLDLLRDEHRIL